MTALIGPGSLALGRRLRPWTHRPLEAAVLEGPLALHYRRLTDRPDRPWVRLGVISEQAAAPVVLSLVGGVLLAKVPGPDGNAILRHDGLGWGPARSGEWAEPAVPSPPTAADLGVPADRLRGVAAIAAGWPQALADEDGSLFGYQQRPDGRWVRSACLRLLDPGPTAANESVKLAQVTGEVDATPTPWGERRPTLSRSESTAGVRGTDLGVRFDHAGRTFLLFGDTHWRGRPWLATRDAIAEVQPGSPLPAVRFHGSPLRVDRASMGEYDVPLDAFSHAGQLYGIFSADHFRGRSVIGRSVLARAEDPGLPLDPAARRRPVRFRVLATLSSRHFLNVSVQLQPDEQALYLWGTGPYRAGEVRLAMLDASALARLERLQREVPTSELGLRYWDGAGWSDEEDAAAPLFRPGALGELSVRWVPEAGRYAMLAASGPEDASGPAVTLRWAAQPSGPWTQRLRLLDWVAGGMHSDPFTRFIKARPDDEVGDQVFRAQARSTGGAYAPYLFDTRRDGDGIVLRYTLSTWNPYQVVLMEHRLVAGEF